MRLQYIHSLLVLRGELEQVRGDCFLLGFRFKTRRLRLTLGAEKDAH
jgi:hypothetical protein